MARLDAPNCIHKTQCRFYHNLSLRQIRQRRKRINGLCENIKTWLPANFCSLYYNSTESLQELLSELTNRDALGKHWEFSQKRHPPKYFVYGGRAHESLRQNTLDFHNSAEVKERKVTNILRT